MAAKTYGKGPKKSDGVFKPCASCPSPGKCKKMKRCAKKAAKGGK